MWPLEEETEAKIVTRQNQVSEQLRYLEEAIEQLTHTVGCVEDRLGPVLRIEDGHEKSEEAIDKAFVPLADHVNALTMRMRRQAERLSHILERLEL